MIFHPYKIKQWLGLIMLILSIVLITACRRRVTAPVIEKPSFKSVLGIPFTEIRRSFKSGVSFNEQGFQLEPDWKFTIVSEDSINIYSPEKKKFFNCPIIFDHDSIFNIAWAWLKVKKITKDSIKFQVLEVVDKQVLYDKSVMYMTVYADSYIKNVLHTNAATLMKPTKQDTAYIKRKSQMAEADLSKAFSGRIPAKLSTKSALVTIKEVTEFKSDVEDVMVAEAYLTPEFNIVIHKAYANFNHPFVIIIDSKGVPHFHKSSINMTMSPELVESQDRVLKGITDGYLMHYINFKPGSTLGIIHPSKILVHVKGIKD